MKVPDGYRLPKGTTMADVRRLDQELLAGEGQVQSPNDKEGHKKPLPEEK
jgi:hypothetical protein